MPVYVLEGSGRVSLPRQVVAVTAEAGGTPVRLEAKAGGAPDPAAVHPGPGLMILPRIGGAVEIGAAPGDGGQVFAQGTVLRVTIGVDSSTNPDPDRAELTPVDVSGMAFVRLASIAPAAAGDRLEVTARKTKVDRELPALAARARAAARAILHSDEWDDADQVRVAVDIDTTISMAPALADGSVEAAVEIIGGIADVVSSRPIRVELVGAERTPLPECGPDDAASVAAAGLEGVSLGMGFRSASPAGGLPADGWGVTVTDAVPADYRDAARGDAPGARRTLVVLARESAGAGIPRNCSDVVIVPPPDGVRTADAMLGAPQELERVVRAVATVLADPVERTVSR